MNVSMATRARPRTRPSQADLAAHLDESKVVEHVDFCLNVGQFI